MGGSELITQGLTALQFATAAPEVSGHVDPMSSRRIAEDFEAVFIGQMLQPMFRSMEAEAPFGGGHAEQIWQSLMVDEIGKAISAQGGIGLADHVQFEILRAQEAR
jgi:Rod binding domain-containing protein